MHTVIHLSDDLQVGSVVVSTADCDFPLLLGTVTEICKHGSPRHETRNDTDDVYVDFYDGGYSEQRKAEIGKHFSELFGEPRTFDECGLDGVIMAPDMLVRADALLGSGDMDKFLNSAEDAQGIYNMLIDNNKVSNC